MSEKTISWFHCGRCGYLFQSPFGAVHERVCTSCGRNPSLGIDPSQASPLAVSNEATKEGEHSPDPAEEHPKHKKRRKNHLFAKIAAGWLLLLAVIFAGARWIRNDAPAEKKPVITHSLPEEATSPSAEEQNFTSEAYGPTRATFLNLLNATTPEQRSQFVLDPISTTSRMARYYGMNPSPNIDSSTVTLSEHTVLHLPSGKALETQWISSDGHLLDAVFIKQDGEWRIDWNHYARYSDMPWALFLSGSGEGQGEFRLLARERLAEERKNADTISLMLYAPRFGYSGDTGFQSPEFLVKRNSRDGRMIQEALDRNKRGVQPFNAKISNIDPEGLIRIRAKIRRFEKDEERFFEIEDIIACHWYSVDDPGMEITVSDDKPTPNAPPTPHASPAKDESLETKYETPAPLD